MISQAWDQQWTLLFSYNSNDNCNIPNNNGLMYEDDIVTLLMASIFELIIDE